MSQHDLLVYAHIGDLHLTDESAQNYQDFHAIVSEIVGALGEPFNFVFLPGDNAENGRPEQYALVAREVRRFRFPIHVVTGDHDMEQGGLDNFYRFLDAAPLPKAVVAAGVRCLFVDMSGPGDGGPDFRIGAAQSKWLVDQLSDAKIHDQRCAIFMHTYPADLKSDQERATVNQAIANRDVLIVDMGHTHYNELANDGRTIYRATRSTGQIEEGAVGYSIVTIDKRIVSWHFRELGARFPIVLITAPADRRLAIDADDPDHLPMERSEIRVSVLGPRRIVTVTCRVDAGDARPMSFIEGNRYALTVALQDDTRAISVEATDEAGSMTSETIEVARRQDTERVRHADGSDADSIGAWEGRGILGTQLGPNRSSRHW
jgi:hypothetical protein